MAEELSAELDLSIDKALATVDDLRSQIEKASSDAAASFATDFAAAVSGVPDVDITPNVDAVEPAITTAIDSVDTAIPIDPDVAAVEPAISTAIAAVDPTVTVEADTDAASSELAALGDGISTTVTVDADTEAAASEIAVLGDGISTSVTVDADTEPAVAAIAAIPTEADTNLSVTVTADTQQAEDSLGGLTNASSDASDSLDTTETAATAVGTATSLSSGSIDTMTNAAGGLVGKMGPVGGVLAGSVVALGSFTNQAVASLGATQRLTTTMGEFASQIEHIQVGNLNTSLKDLAINTGSSGSAMRNAAADSFQMVTSFGVGKDAAAGYSAEVLALAAHAVALNPELGETGQVAEQLNSAFRSGRDRALVPYALGITSVEINVRAAQIAHADLRTEVTQADKAMAGAALASEKLGGSLKQDIAEGAKDPILQVRALTKEFASATTEIGKPLVAPILEALHAALPGVTATGKAVAELATAALPLLTSAFQALSLVMTPVAEIMGELPGPILLAAAAFTVLGVSAARSQGQLGGSGKAMQDLATNSDLLNRNGEKTSGIMSKIGAGGTSLGQGMLFAAGGTALAATGIQQITDGSGDATTGIESMAASGASFGAIWGPEGAVIGGVAGAIAGLTVNAIAGGESVEHYRASFAKLGTEIEGLSQKAATTKFVEKLGMDDFIKLAAGGATAVKGISDELTALGSSAPAAANKVLAGLKAMRDESGKPLFTGAEFDQLVAAANKGVAAHQKVAEAELKSAQADQAYAAGVQITGGAVDTTSLSLQEMGEKFDFTKQQTDAATQAFSAHATAAYQAQIATQQAALATSDLAASDALAVQSTKDAALASRDLADGQKAVATENASAAEAVDAATQAAARYAFGVGTAAEAADAMGRAQQALATIFDQTINKFADADTATTNFAKASRELGDTLFANGYSFDVNTAAGDNNRLALDQLATSAGATATAIFKSTGDLGQAEAPLISFRGQITKLRDDMVTAGADPAAINFLNGILGGINQSITDLAALATPAHAAGKGVGDATAGGVGEGLAPIPDQFASVAEVGAAQFYGKAPAGTTAGQGFGAATAAGAAAGVAPVPDQFAAVAEAGAALFYGKAPVAHGAGQAVGDATATGHKAGLAPIGGNAAAAGQDSADGIQSKQEANKAVADALGAGANAAAAAAIGNWFAYGEAAGEGLAIGITSTIGSVIAAATGLADVANAAFKNHLSITSPSKVIRDEVGVPIGQGLVVGIESQRGAVESVSRSVAQSAVDAGASTASGGTGHSIATQFDSSFDVALTTAVAGGFANGQTSGQAVLDFLEQQQKVANAFGDKMTAELDAVRAVQIRSLLPPPPPTDVTTPATPPPPPTPADPVPVAAQIDWKPLLDALAGLDKDVVDAAGKQLDMTSREAYGVYRLVQLAEAAAQPAPAAATIGAL